MRLVDRNTKQLMEDCKKKARDFGLEFQDESIEYIASNQDMIELSSKTMLPTLYDFWLQDVETLKGRGQYQVFPHNPFETVINTKPPISFYNNDNPDWMNVAIFYHVLGHIDFFQNNQFFSNTWSDDMCGRALSHKRRINEIRKELGENKRLVDYIIEFTRQIDNLVNIHTKLRENPKEEKKEKINYYFTDFLREKDLSTKDYLEEIENYNSMVREFGEETAKASFISHITQKYPELESMYSSYLEKEEISEDNLIDYIMNNSPVVNESKNYWMKEVMQIVKETAEYFTPQMFTKCLNEGWATFIHNELFLQDDYLKGHEADFAKFNSAVTQVPKIGLNPYALGYNLLEYIKDLGDKGKLTYEFQKIKDIVKRDEFDQTENKGLDILFQIRRWTNDILFLNFLDEDNFQDFVYQNNLYVSSRKLNFTEWKWEYYIKSRNGEDYRNMVLDKLPHPPYIDYCSDSIGRLILSHKFEGKQLHTPFIENVLRGINFLWGKPVSLETIEFELENQEDIYKWLQGEEVSYKKQVMKYEITDYSKSISKSKLREI